MPSLRLQREVGGILGTIDDLIENMRRRINALEEMARAIYREWFVHFRYPGHQNATYVDSSLGPIPEKWRVGRLDEVAELTGGNTTTKASYVEKGYVAFSAAGPDGFLPGFEVEGGGVVLSAVGARCGRTFRASGRWSSIANTIKIRPRLQYCGPAWLYLAIPGPDSWPKRGSAQPFISVNDARAVEVMLADAKTMSAFDSTAGALYASADTITNACTRLAVLRDCLLPKLVTGAIDVSTLDLDAIAEES